MNQKRENLLNLALETEENPVWEVIVKYHGDLEDAVTVFGAGSVSVETLIAGYAILEIPRLLVEEVTNLPQIEYMEIPKSFYYEEDLQNLNPGCRLTLPVSQRNLSGRGVLVLVADSGIDWKRQDFRRANGTTRIRALWDQTLIPGEGRLPPEGFRIGVEFGGEEINRALAEEREAEGFLLVPSVDVSGHGTAVAGIAAGKNESSGYQGIAYEAELLIVKLGKARETGFPRTTEIMRAVTWGLKKAQEAGMPLAVNLSFGNAYGSHDGSSLLERFLDNASEIGRTVICVGTGNEASSGGHVAGQARETSREVELAVGRFERNLRVQFWQNYSDVFRIFLQSPSNGTAELTAPTEGGKFTLSLGNNQILAYQGEPAPYAVAQELYLEFLPQNEEYVESGIWRILVEPVRTVTGRFYLYLPDSAARSPGTFFYTPTPDVTLTIPSTAAKVISVGAYDTVYDTYADFSGRGYADSARTIGVVPAGIIKPDLVAPGVNIPAPDLYGGYSSFTGTSFAVPQVCGAAALLMEWGIVGGRDPFLYGEKIKACLRRGARPLRGEQTYPNERVGWGAMCIRQSFPDR